MRRNTARLAYGRPSSRRTSGRQGRERTAMRTSGALVGTAGVDHRRISSTAEELFARFPDIRLVGEPAYTRTRGSSTGSRPSRARSLRSRHGGLRPVSVPTSPRDQSSHDHPVEGIGTLRTGHWLAWRRYARKEIGVRSVTQVDGGEVSSRGESGRSCVSPTWRLKSAPKLSFDTGGEFIRQTRREVDEYLSDPRTRARGRAALYAKGWSRSSCCSARG